MKIRIRIGNLGKPECEQYHFDFGNERAFTLLRTECDDFLKSRDWRRLYTDLSRVLIVENCGVTVVRVDHSPPLGQDTSAFESQGWHVWVDVRKLLRRAIEVAPKMPKDKWETVIPFEFKLSRFRSKAEAPARKTVMELVRTFADDWQRKRFVESLVSFRSLSRTNWGRLIDRLSHYSANGQLHGGGKGEINFRAFGMFGGIICREEDFSIHT